MCSRQVGRRIAGANVFGRNFCRAESYATSFLEAQGLTRFDTVNYSYHGIVETTTHSKIGITEDIRSWVKQSNLALKISKLKPKK